MAYRIYEIIKPERDDYDLKTTESITLKEVDCYGLNWSYVSEVSAKIDIEQNKKNLKHKDLVILEVINITPNALYKASSI